MIMTEFISIDHHVASFKMEKDSWSMCIGRKYCGEVWLKIFFTLTLTVVMPFMSWVVPFLTWHEGRAYISFLTFGQIMWFENHAWLAKGCLNIVFVSLVNSAWAWILVTQGQCHFGMSSTQDCPFVPMWAGLCICQGWHSPGSVLYWAFFYTPSCW